MNSQLTDSENVLLKTTNKQTTTTTRQKTTRNIFIQFVAIVQEYDRDAATLCHVHLIEVNRLLDLHQHRRDRVHRLAEVHQVEILMILVLKFKAE
jgi:hypothetical protein